MNVIKDLYTKCTNDSYNSTTTNNFDLKLGKRSHQRREKMANMHMKRCLISYVIKEFQSKAKTRYYNTSIRKMKWKLFSPFWLFATPRTIVHQAALSMGFSRHEYWSGLPCPPPGGLSTQGLNLGLLHCGQILYHLSHQGSPRIPEWVAYPFSRGSFWPRNQTGVSYITDGFTTSWATRIAKTEL